MQSVPQSQLRARPARPPSIAPSISSVLSDATTITAPAHVQRGFKSREAYLAALHEFAESKQYMPVGDHTLYGVYGGETMDARKQRMLAEKEKRRSFKRAMNADSTASKERTRSIPAVTEASNSEVSADLSRAEQTTGGGDDVPAASNIENRATLRKLSRVFSSKKLGRDTSEGVP